MSSPAVSSFYTSPSDPLSSVALAPKPGAFDWNSSHDITKDLREKNERLEDGSLQQAPHNMTTSKDSAVTPPARRPSAGMQKLSFGPSLMLSQQVISESIKSNPKSAAPREPYVRDEVIESPVASNLRRLGNRWSFNGSLEPAIANWDLAEEIGNLQIGNGSIDGPQLTTTPPKNPVNDMLHMHETSPLDTSSSDASLDSISPPDEDRLALPSHSRGSSTDSVSSESSSVSQTLISSLQPSVDVPDLTKDRPRSFSGVYPDAELRRLQQADTAGQTRPSSQDKRSSPLRDGYEGDNMQTPSAFNQESVTQQPMFPSLTSYPQTQQSAPGSGLLPRSGQRDEELQVDHNLQPRHFLNQSFASAPQSVPVRASQGETLPYRQQPPRPITLFQPHMQMSTQGPPALLPSPTNFAYPNHPNAHHNSHLSLGNSQQLYEMMLPPLDAAVSRTQHTFRGAHQHSASDPATLRDAAALLLSNGVHTLQGASYAGPTPGLYPPMGLPTPALYPNQYYAGVSMQAQDAYNQEMVNAMGRTVPQYSVNGVPTVPGPYGAVQTHTTGGSNGPSANNRKLGLYKTELCRSWEEKGSCRYGPKCQFAHGEEEIRKVSRHPKYKTEICRTFWVSGSCPYGKRCCFIHTELPTSGAAPGADGNPPPPPGPDGRARSLSSTTNSDTTDQPVSLLQRISAQRSQDVTTPIATTPGGKESPSQNNYQFTKPPTGSLRVDTNVLDAAGAKQNKSAFPTFASNIVSAISPGPVTAGPDFGRHNSMARVNVVDASQQRLEKTGTSSVRHSFNGTEGITLNSLRSVSGNSSPFGMLTTDTPTSSTGTPVQGHGHGHSRSGSSGTWGSFSSHNGHLAAPSPYSHSPSPGNDLPSGNAAASSPWATSELSRPWA
ncbi:hypothetical protein BD410DRAFT_863436 [Rickenella mellea]|uniref:C3H1-type domain-containing protein n=1 Tax=Rickenella mellea TaxID=50990 RepID=A0A4Y7QMC2_9AGAM|nr:hypothetical protein BD410DRAFT_863436 [Rickenella mellea]